MLDLGAVAETMFNEHGPWLMSLGLALAAILVLGSLLRLIFGPGKHPYQPTEFLFTPAERRFMKALDRAVGSRYWLAGKVRVADILKVHGIRREKRWWKAFTKISSKHVDWVICSPGDFRILAAVELDDSSHQTKDRAERDQFLDKAFAAAGVPLLRFPVQSSYSPNLIRQVITQTIGDDSRQAA